VELASEGRSRDMHGSGGTAQRRGRSTWKDFRKFERGYPHDQPAAFFRERRFGFTSASTAGAATLSAAADVLFRFS
jgi:hypothetical protein